MEKTDIINRIKNKESLQLDAMVAVRTVMTIEHTKYKRKLKE